MTTVAEQFVRVLRQAWVERIYGVVGDSRNPIVDAVRRTSGIEWVHVRNEEPGAFAAAAEAQLTGHLAVCAGSCGPGNTHLIQGPHISPDGRPRVIGSVRHGSMAHALPHAIGAQLAYARRQVISMSGDGGLGMLLGELLTVRLHYLPVKIATSNKSSLGMVRLEMLVDGLPHFETDHRSVDYASIVQAMGIDAIRVEAPGDVHSALSEAMGTSGPVLVDLVTDSNALSIPPHITVEEVKGFALAASTITLGGGVGQMLEVARANLCNIPRP
jgi:thiamine pyrophosphate-dependent acetolactate synthase large subunit-like protein